MVGRGHVEFRKRRQSGILATREQLVPVKAADGGDPRAARDGLRTRGDSFLNVGD